MPVPDVTGVVLAGGRSTRFGDANKALATFEGAPILERVVSTVETATGRPPVVAVRTADQRETYASCLPPAVEYATDAPTHEGPVAGVLGALGAVETSWVFVCGCDMPTLSTAAIAWQLDWLAAAIAGPDPPAAVAVASADDTPQPLHATFRVDAVDRVRDGLPTATGVRGLFDVLSPVATVSVSDAPASVPLERSLSNVNTREDLAALAAEATADD